jgi:hypothetical protein
MVAESFGRTDKNTSLRPRADPRRTAKARGRPRASATHELV